MKPIIWFIHVPRTGGITTAKFLGKLQREKQIKLFHMGHTKYSNRFRKAKESLFGSPIITFTILREPIKHSKSLYSYIRGHRNHIKHTMAKNLDFYNWSLKFEEFPYYVKFFSSKHTIDSAAKTLLSIDYILYTNHLSSGINKLLSAIGINKKFDNTHQNKSRKIISSNNDNQIIKKVRAEDYKLLKIISQKHPNRLI